MSQHISIRKPSTVVKTTGFGAGLPEFRFQCSHLVISSPFLHFGSLSEGGMGGGGGWVGEMENSRAVVRVK